MGRTARTIRRVTPITTMPHVADVQCGDDGGMVASNKGGSNADLIIGWKLDQRRRGLTESTIYRRATMIRSFALWLDGGLEAATENDVQRFLDGRRIGARTRYTWISAIGCFYLWAVRHHGVAVNPTADIVRPKLRRTLPRPIGDDDLAVALAMAPNEVRLWLTLAAYAGLRCAEVAGLHRDDVLRDSGVLRVVGKGNKERLVPMHPFVVDGLDAWPRPRVNGPMFVRPQGGAWPPNQISRVASLYLHDVGIEATMHQLRHWFGTRTYQVSKDLRVVQELLGHSSPTTTAIYTAFSNEDAVAAVMGIGVTRQAHPTLW